MNEENPAIPQKPTKDTPPPPWALEMLNILEEADKIVSDSWSEVDQAEEKEKIEIPQVVKDQLTGWQKKWIEWFVAWLNSTSEETTTPKEEDVPLWLQNVEKKIARAGSPTVNYKALLQKRPTQSVALTVGEIVGHAHSAWSYDNVGAEASVTLACQRIKSRYRELAEDSIREKKIVKSKAEIDAKYNLWIQLGEQISAQLEKFLARQNNLLRPKLLDLIRRALALTVTLPQKDTKQFFRGYSLAMQRGTLSDAGTFAGETDATRIYNTLWLYSEFVPELQSVTELHAWLQSILGKKIAGDKKRIEKICERIGLTFRSSGRPLGS